MLNPSDIKEILLLLEQIDGFARDSRGCYENARGNDYACYGATQTIRDILKQAEQAEKGKGA